MKKKAQLLALLSIPGFILIAIVMLIFVFGTAFLLTLLANITLQIAGFILLATVGVSFALGRPINPMVVRMMLIVGVILVFIPFLFAELKQLTLASAF